MTDAELSDVQRRNVELVQRAVEVIEREGVVGLASRYDEFFNADYEWEPRMSGFGRTYRGREEFHRYIADMEETMGEVDFTEHSIRAIDDQHVLLLGHLRLVGRESGLPFESEYGILYRLESGRFGSGHAFDSHGEAEEAAADA